MLFTTRFSSFHHHSFLPRMPARSSGVWQVSERQLSSLRAMRHDDARETCLGRVCLYRLLPQVVLTSPALMCVVWLSSRVAKSVMLSTALLKPPRGHTTVTRDTVKRHHCRSLPRSSLLLLLLLLLRIRQCTPSPCSTSPCFRASRAVNSDSYSSSRDQVGQEGRPR